MKRVVAIIILNITFNLAFAQDEKPNIYSGGMLILQPGITTTTNNHQDIRDTSFGLGGILRFYLFNHFTTGIYGGTQRTGYQSSNSDNSNISLGYGGPFVGYSQKIGRFRLTASAFMGMGTIRNLHIESQNVNTLSDAHLYKYSAIVISPIISADFAVTQRLLLTVQGVYLNAHYNRGKRLQNPTLQIGILFNR